MGTGVVSGLERSLTFPCAVIRLAGHQATDLEAGQVYGAVCSGTPGAAPISPLPVESLKQE